ncbi:Golgi pH regulator-like 2, partial [Homarus americanus]
MVLIFFIGGWVWFVKKIFRDYEVHNTLVQLFFPMIFMLSCAMFELIIFEIAAVLESGSRYLYWQVVLYSMLIMLILVIPFYLCHFAVSNIRMDTSDENTPSSDTNHVTNVPGRKRYYCLAAGGSGAGQSQWDYVMGSNFRGQVTLPHPDKGREGGSAPGSKGGRDGGVGEGSSDVSLQVTARQFSRPPKLRT